MGDPQVTIGFNTKMVIHDLDDLGVLLFQETPISHLHNIAVTWVTPQAAQFAPGPVRQRGPGFGARASHPARQRGLRCSAHGPFGGSLVSQTNGELNMKNYAFLPSKKMIQMIYLLSGKSELALKNSGFDL